MKVELLAVTQAPEVLIQRAGKTCYRSKAAGDPAEFIKARMSQGHHSIIEHASATFEISGISRACSHQLVRHRLASYSQESQRYVDMADCEFVVPPSIESDPRATELWDEFTEAVRGYYKELRDIGIRKEDARFVLPNAAPTKIVVTMNFRSLLHFFELRLSRKAQWEIREVARLMLEQIRPFAPDIFEGVEE